MIHLHELSCKYPIDGHSKKFIENLLNQNPALVPEFIDYYEKAIERSFEVISAIPQGAERATKILELADAAIANYLIKAAQGGHVPTCKKGCAHCCHVRIDVSTSEVDLIVQKMKQDKLLIDFDRLKIQAGKEDIAFYTPRMGKGNNRCVFLGDDNECKIYDARPLFCRSHFAVGDAEKCTMDVEGAKTMLMYIDVVHILGASWYLLENPVEADLAAALLKRKEEICQST
jgi:Fe-S-cluster containining protein